MKKFLFLFAALLLLAGCESLPQDYQAGKSNPEIRQLVQKETQAVTGVMSVIPYANMAAPVAAILFPYLAFAWHGHRFRKQNLNASDRPITGAVGQAVRLEAIVQHLADVTAGLFEVGPQGSVLKRGWKMAILTGLAALITPEIHQLIPALQAHHPGWMDGMVLSLVVGGLSAVEKALSKVLPVEASHG